MNSIYEKRIHPLIVTVCSGILIGIALRFLVDSFPDWFNSLEKTHSTVLSWREENPVLVRVFVVAVLIIISRKLTVFLTNYWKALRLQWRALLPLDYVLLFLCTLLLVTFCDTGLWVWAITVLSPFLITLTIVRIIAFLLRAPNAERNTDVGIVTDTPLKSWKAIEKIRETEKAAFSSLKKSLDEFSKLLESILQSELTHSSYAICIDGRWGTGKTSFINLVKEKIPDNSASLRWMEFNPWQFGDATEQIQGFFAVLDHHVRELNGRGLGSDMNSYVEMVTPAIESHPLLKILGRYWHLFAQKNINQTQSEISDTLRALKSKIVIVIDDIDRLSPVEVIEVMRLVKAISDFPNLVFILPFDYRNVSSIISKQYGADYINFLPKLINTRWELDLYPPKDLLATFTAWTSINKELPDRELILETYLLYGLKNSLKTHWPGTVNWTDLTDPVLDTLFQIFHSSVFENPKTSNTVSINFAELFENLYFGTHVYIAKNKGSKYISRLLWEEILRAQINYHPAFKTEVLEYLADRLDPKNTLRDKIKRLSIDGKYFEEIEALFNNSQDSHEFTKKYLRYVYDSIGSPAIHDQIMLADKNLPESVGNYINYIFEKKRTALDTLGQLLFSILTFRDIKQLANRLNLSNEKTENKSWQDIVKEVASQQSFGRFV